MSLSYRINSDNVVEVNGLQDSITGAYVNDATVTTTLYDRDGAQVAGQSWPTALGYASGTDGIYRGLLSDALVVTKTYPYRLVVTMASGTLDREITEEVYVL